jgi:hypothetical protein
VSVPGTSLTISGTLAAVNSDLAHLQDKDTTAGADTITLTAVDGNGVTATPQTIAVTVNAAPVLAAPPGQAVASDIAALLTGLSLSESGNTAGETFTVSLAGNLSSSGITLGAPTAGHYGTDSLSFSGSFSTVNSDLADLYYRSTTPAETDNIIITTTDSFDNSISNFFDVETMGTLSISAPASISVPRNPAGVVINPGSIAEIPSFVGETFTLTLQDTTGLLSLNPNTLPYPVTLTGNGTTKLTMVGAIYAINDALPLLTDAETASDTITLNASDSLGQTAAQAKIAVTVEAAPVVTAPATATVAIGKLDAISGVSVSESGAIAGETFTVKLADSHGDLSLSSTAAGSTVTGSGTTGLTISGTLVEVNTDLGKLEDTDATAGADKISLTGSDSRGNIGGTTTIAVTANGAPTITGPISIRMGVDETVPPTSLQYAIAEAGNTANETFTVKLTDAHGIFPVSSFNLNATESGAGTKTLTISGPLAAVNSDLAAVSYQNKTAGTDTITETVTDSFGNATTDTVPVTINAPPVIHAPSSFTWEIPSFGNDLASLTEAGNTSGELFTVNISDASATFNTFDDVISGNDTNDMTLQSTLGNINTDLDDIFCTEPAGNTDAVTVKVTDGFDATSSVTYNFTIVASGFVVAKPDLAAALPQTAVLSEGSDGTIQSSGPAVTASLAEHVLTVSGTGAVTMGASISANTVLLSPGPAGLSFIANADAGLVVDDRGKVASTLQAGGMGQTLTGGGGQDEFLGFAGGDTTFKDTTAAFDGDTIGNFAAPGSVLDFTDMALQSLSLSFAENSGGTAGVLSVSDGQHAARLTLTGSFTAADFVTGLDKGGLGTIITYHGG